MGGGTRGRGSAAEDSRGAKSALGELFLLLGFGDGYMYVQVERMSREVGQPRFPSGGTLSLATLAVRASPGRFPRGPDVTRRGAGDAPLQE